ncbi:hypothetical protein QP027_01170 [Corynebacterium breve]|uniref:DUF2231 domain-containing protein n=1 Tax=Corynebacterium breve TaxID=3049799 RepID=A0ABY8VG01_9CORY|nr:DUF2231 domain-containing protein [Corynebacterium breve]WIM68042.1 hypothetical protein QP027_01170 [Corynebacterium breve]
MFTMIAGIPAHPLFVHGSVVLIPLTALLGILWALVPRFRTLLRWPTMIGVAVSVIALILTRTTGEALVPVNEPGIHEAYANAFTVATGLMVLLLIALAVMLGRDMWAKTWGVVVRWLVAVSAVAVLVTSVLAGHSGAQLVWKDEAARIEAVLETSAS